MFLTLARVKVCKKKVQISVPIKTEKLVEICNKMRYNKFIILHICVAIMDSVLKKCFWDMKNSREIKIWTNELSPP